MPSTETLLTADQKRRYAMIAGDVTALRALLSEHLIWTHSSGKTDDREAVLASIASRSVEYLSLHLEESQVLIRGYVYIHTGIISGQVTKDGVGKALRNRFHSVWDSTSEGLQMLTWQSTGLS